MISLRKTANWLASPKLAAVLLVVVGIWSFLGTLVPQGVATDSKVVAWGIAHPALQPLVSALGFHQTFASPAFAVLMLLLAASTAVCSWRRTKVALRRHGLLRGISDADAHKLVEHPTFTVTASAESSGDPVELASEALRRMGLKLHRRQGLTIATSRPWVVFGSPVFHWALLLLILAILGGRLYRAEGLIGVPEGDSRPLAEKSFGLLDKGPFYRFAEEPLLFRVDKMNLSYPVDGIDRGPAPTVSVVRPDGSIAANQVVYPNNSLRYGSLVVYPSEIGLSPGFALVSPDGAETARTNLVVDFDEAAPSGTGAAEFTLTANDPEASIVGTVTVPLQKLPDGKFAQLAPNPPRATFTLRPISGGAPVAEGTLDVGEELPLPDGSRLRLLGVGYYARLSVVDDSSIPLIYALLLIGLVGLSISVLGRQSLAVVTAAEGPDGSTSVAVWFRDWRANAVRSAQAEQAVREALQPDGSGGVAGD